MRRRDLIERGRIQARGGPTAAANAAPAPAPPPAAVEGQPVAQGPVSCVAGTMYHPNAATDSNALDT